MKKHIYRTFLIVGILLIPLLSSGQKKSLPPSFLPKGTSTAMNTHRNEPTTVRVGKSVSTTYHIWTLESIDFTSTYTICYWSVIPKQNDTYIQMSRGVYLIDNKGKRYYMSSCDGISLEPQYDVINYKRKVDFRVIFPAIDIEATSITYYSSSSFQIGDINIPSSKECEINNEILINRNLNEVRYTVKGVSFEMVHVEGGSFTMGATYQQLNDSQTDEKPAHLVTLKGFFIGKTEVTQALWRAVMGNNPSYFKGDNLPVEHVSWDDYQEFIRELNKVTGENFRLPTEAEWEYAARGGNKSRGYKYSGSNIVTDVAWYNENSRGKTHPVATRSPNELGIYDMSGNVWEWCSDYYGSDYYSNSPQNNPQGPSSGLIHVFRGGSWSYFSYGARVSNRDRGYSSSDSDNFVGLRLVMDY